MIIEHVDDAPAARFVAMLLDYSVAAQADTAEQAMERLVSIVQVHKDLEAQGYPPLEKILPEPWDVLWEHKHHEDRMKAVSRESRAA